MKIPLSRSYDGIIFAPTISFVDPQIFTMRADMDCGNCHGKCCAHGCDIDHAEISSAVAVCGNVKLGPSNVDREFATGLKTRIQPKRNGGCQCLAANGLCKIHSYANATGSNWMAIKPVVCSLYPLTWDSGCLIPSESIPCRDHEGISLFGLVSNVLMYFYGRELCAELATISNGSC